MKGIKSNVLRGLMSVFAVLLAILVGGQSIAGSRAAFINSRLGTSNYEVVRHESDIDSIYFKSEFNTLGDLVGELQNVAAELSSEGSVLLKNENNALPIDKGSETVTLWGLNSANPVLGGLIGSSVAVGEGTALNYEVLSQAVCSVRAGAPLGAGWKERIDRDYKRRKR